MTACEQLWPQNEANYLKIRFYPNYLRNLQIRVLTEFVGWRGRAEGMSRQFQLCTVYWITEFHRVSQSCIGRQRKDVPPSTRKNGRNKAAEYFGVIIIGMGRRGGRASIDLFAHFALYNPSLALYNPSKH